MGLESEYNDYEHNGSWTLVYQNIRQESITQHNFSSKEARKPQNRALNRYRDVSPYDHSRVVLGRGDVDYINASLVPVSEADRAYVLTQGPLATTAGHFWLMVWEQKSMVVLMLNRIIEKGAVKCYQYFPVGEANEGENEMVFPDVNLKVTFVSEDNSNFYTVRTLLLEDLLTGECRRILQFHYTTWPDFGVPDSPAQFLRFLRAVRQSGGLSPRVGPAVVHCSAGIGRSGTFCIVDSCLVLIEKNGSTDCVNIYEMLMKMRRYRMGLIQTPLQLKFTYLAVIEASRLICSPTYVCEGDEGPADVPSGPQVTTPAEDAAPQLPLEEESQTIHREAVEVRRRDRASRRSNTAAQLERMKTRQREVLSARPRSTFWRSHAPGIAVATAVVVVGWLAYNFYSTDGV